MIQASSLFKPNTGSLSRITAGVSAGVSRAASIVADEAKATVAVDKGDLRDSIEAGEPEQDKDLSGAGNAVTAIVSAGTDHAIYVEFGTGQRGEASPGAGPGPYDPEWKGMPAQPYLRPALDTRRADILGAIAGEVASATS